jgi:hypothetical protein
MAENILKNEVLNHDGTAVTNWISQINVADTIYDIATHHGITFKDGKGDTVGTTWNGLTDLEIVIPNITDIVQTPIEFAGTVDGDGKITWTNGHGETPEVGNLVFIAADCTFEGKACEAGDMAIFDGENWNVVSGENQVSIVGTMDGDNRATIAIGASKDVLTVEGKTLALTLDYADLNDNHLTKSNGGVVNVAFGDMTVDSIGIKLNKAADVTNTIGEEKSFQKATKLADGTVALENATGLVNGITWGEFNAGTATTHEMNKEKDLVVTGGNLDLTSKQETGAFVDSVKINDIKFAEATKGEAGSISMVTGISVVEGQSFVNGIHTTGTDETADLTIKGYALPTNGMETKFVEGLVDNLNPVTSITAGAFNLVDGSDLATGFGVEGDAGDVVSNVSVTANNDTPVYNSMSVTDHVLSFGTTKVTSNVSTTCKYKSLTKTGFEYIAPKATTTAFVTSGFKNADDVKYTFGKAKETTYETTSANWKLNTPALTVTMGSYSFNDDGMKANVPEGTFVASVTAGALPTLGTSSFTTTDVTGSVKTDLTTEEFKFNALLENTFVTSGAYSLSTVAEGGDITVGKAGALADKNASVDLSAYLTDVAIVEKKN